MPRPRPPLLLPALVIAIVLALLALSGCGDSGDSLTHIDGSSASIGKPMLDHWMRAMVTRRRR